MSPFVSIIVPCFNEERTIGFLLDAILRQTYPIDDIEVLIADGMSTDATRDIVKGFKREYPDLHVRLVDNPKRVIPAALNRAIEHSKGDILVRLDAHSMPARDYVERCVSVIKRTGAANVGGAWDIQPSEDDWIARAIAIAAAHPLGAGGARYRTGGEAGETDTVPFGAFPRTWLEKVGRFDEELETNEDYEYNVRLKQAGGVIYFDPEIRSTYYARPDLISLGKQYARYGFWKARMLKRFPSSLRWRQAIPPLFICAIIFLAMCGFLLKPAWWLLGIVLGIYLAVTCVAGLISGLHRRDLFAAIGVPLAFWVMHFAWGGAFLWSVFRGLIRRYH